MILSTFLLLTMASHFLNFFPFVSYVKIVPSLIPSFFSSSLGVNAS